MVSIEEVSRGLEKEEMSVQKLRIGTIAKLAVKILLIRGAVRFQGSCRRGLVTQELWMKRRVRSRPSRDKLQDWLN